MPVGADEPWDRRRPACMEPLCEPPMRLLESILAVQAFIERGSRLEACGPRESVLLVCQMCITITL